MCLAGGLLRSASGAFQAGDWVQVGGRSGEVTEQTLLSTTLWEFDGTRQEFTGRQTTLPNSLFLTAPVINHGFRRRFVFHEFTIFAPPAPLPPPGAEALRAAIERALCREAEDFAPVAARFAELDKAQRWGVEEGQLSLASKMINSQVINRLVREYIDGARDAAATVEMMNEELAKVQ